MVLADGAGEVFLFGDAVGEGLGVAFVVERFRCFRDGVGVGVASTTFLSFVPNDSSAAWMAIVPKKIAMLKKIRSIVLEAIGFVGRFCETLTSPASDTDALQSTPPRLIFMGRILIAGSKISARVPGESLCLTEFRLQGFREENSHSENARDNRRGRGPSGEFQFPKCRGTVRRSECCLLRE